MESWSIEHNIIYSVVENLLVFNPGQYQYTDRNSVVRSAVQQALARLSSPESLSVNVGVTVYCTQRMGQGLIPAGTEVIAFGAGTVTMGNALGIHRGSTSLPSRPWDFDIPRAFGSRMPSLAYASGSTGLDGIDFEGGRDKNVAIGLKGIQAPWPIVGWYNPTFPLGNVFFYPAPTGVSCTSSPIRFSRTSRPQRTR